MSRLSQKRYSWVDDLERKSSTKSKDDLLEIMPCHNIVLVRGNLYRRIITNSSICPLCGTWNHWTCYPNVWMAWSNLVWISSLVCTQWGHAISIHQYHWMERIYNISNELAHKLNAVTILCVTTRHISRTIKCSFFKGESISKVYCDSYTQRLLQMYRKKLRPSFRGLAILKACAYFKN